MSHLTECIGQIEAERGRGAFEAALADVESLITNSGKYTHALIYDLLTMRSGALFGALGGSVARELGSFTYGHSDANATSRLTFVRHLVLVEILDDGDPAVGYYKYADHLGFVCCTAAEDGATPYFHRNHELAIAGSQHLNIMAARRVVAFHAALDAENTRLMLEDDTFPGSDSDGEPSEFEKNMRLLANELFSELGYD